MKNQISRLLIVGGFVLCFVAGAAFHSIPGATQTAKSHIRLNQHHAQTVFRVRVDGLESHTTYYYKVDSMQAGGTSDEVTSPVNKFTTP